MVAIRKFRGKKYVRFEDYMKLLSLVELSDETIKELTRLLGRRSVSDS